MRPDDWTAVVRKNWQKTQAYIVSSRHPSCLRMAKDEVQYIQRRMERVLLADVEKVRPPLSWFMAVIVCPGDDLGPLAQWARGHAGRVHFYLHADASPMLLAPWRDAGLPLSRVAMGFRSYGAMHKELGLDLNDQVYADFAP